MGKLKVDANKNDNTYNPKQPYDERPENLLKSRNKAKSSSSHRERS